MAFSSAVSIALSIIVSTVRILYTRRHWFSTLQIDTGHSQ